VIGRREALICACVAALTCTRSVFAQVRAKVYRLGYLMPRAAPTTVDEAFIHRLQELGYSEGRNLTIEFRWAGNDLDRLPSMAEDLARMNVDVIVTATTAGTRAAMRATRSIPIVMAATADPVAAGLVDSLGRPGGNVTGMSLQTVDIAPKRLQQMREIVPGAVRVGLLAEGVKDSASGTTDLLVAQTRAAAAATGIDLTVQKIMRADELVPAFAWFREQRVQALLVQVSQLTLANRARIVELAASERLPAMYEVRDFVDAGGLVSYGPDLRESYRLAASYVERIFKGAKPGDLPVRQPDKLALVVNVKAAKAIGLPIPRSVLLRADE